MTQRYDKYLYDVAKGLINGVYDNAVKGRRSGEKIPYFYTTVCDFNVAISLNYDSEIGLSHKLFVPDFMSKIDMDGTFIKKWDSIKDATYSIVGHNSGRIVDCLKGRSASAYGYIWKYAA